MKLGSKGRVLQHRMLDEYGTTKDIKRAAFVLRDGSLITYRGTQKASHSAMATRVGASSASDFLCSTGAIKLHWWNAANRVVHACAYRPTSQQRDALAKFLYVPLRATTRPTIHVDVDKGNERFNRWAGSCAFEPHQRPNVTKIVRCIVEKGAVRSSRSK